MTDRQQRWTTILDESLPLPTPGKTPSTAWSTSSSANSGSSRRSYQPAPSSRGGSSATPACPSITPSARQELLTTPPPLPSRRPTPNTSGEFSHSPAQRAGRVLKFTQGGSLHHSSHSISIGSWKTPSPRKQPSGALRSLPRNTRNGSEDGGFRYKERGTSIANRTFRYSPAAHCTT